MKITILSETTLNPITKIGERAGICQGANITDPVANYKRGIECLESNHGRAFEYVNVELCIADVSARVIREWYTHIGGMPTRLQESTRYVNFDKKPFGYVIPPSIKGNPRALKVYQTAMAFILQSMRALKAMGVPNEDATMLLPLGSTTMVVDKRNLRSHMDMSHTRLCDRAFWEYRDIEREIMRQLSALSEEWAYIIEHYFMPNCQFFGRCRETRKCKKNKERSNANGNS
ncbi:MAG: FAD-dependent thymidylate synthase [Oscillospiraceae bacterium]|nr:FAD-dependent thymidylate synthase [Oscillospiraceae bacterium]